ncbi:MAG: hypothetical protein ABIR59_13320 [Gemmatimonadales bacterium]
MTRLLLISALVLTGACAADLPVAPETSSSILASQVAAAPSRPAGGSCTTTVSVDISVPPLTIDISGVCNLKHLGRTTMTARQTVDITNGQFTNTTTYRAANGDLLLTTFSGQTTSPPGADVTFVGVETYVGGTGRFAGATGSSEASGSATLAGLTGTGEYTTHGSISF